VGEGDVEEEGGGGRSFARRLSGNGAVKDTTEDDEGEEAPWAD